MSFPDDEKRQPWLPHLLDAYAIIDTGVSIAIRREKKQGREIACKRGCDACCSQKDIPLYPHEIVGIYWFASEKTESPARNVLKARLSGSQALFACPFLVDGSCAIHPVRPFSCRQFNVFGTPCARGEDPYYSRRWDVLVPISEYTDRAFEAVIPIYNIKKGTPSIEAVRLIRSRIMNLRSFDWKGLVAVMEKTERAKTEECICPRQRSS